MNGDGNMKRGTFNKRLEKETKLPLVLSKVEIAALLKTHSNLNLRTMLALTYSGRLCVSEVQATRPEDLLFDRGLVRIAVGKINKDMATLLRCNTAELMRT